MINIASSTNIDTLPDDESVQIFSKLSMRELGRVTCVNQRCYRVGNFDALWKQHAEKIARVSEDKYSVTEHKFDYQSTKPIKEQIRDSQISIPHAKIFPILQEVYKCGKIIYSGKIEFTFKGLQPDQKLDCAKAAIAYFPENHYFDISDLPLNGDNTVFYKEKEVATWCYHCDNSSYFDTRSAADSKQCWNFETRMKRVDVSRDDYDPWDGL